MSAERAQVRIQALIDPSVASGRETGLQVAVITKRPNGYFITHVEGATYPTLNGASLGGQAHPLGDHDLIEIAGVKMEFFYKP